jgi:membrane protein DedA with SNARE-associated domain
MRRAVRTVLRLVAAGSFVWGGLLVLLEYLRTREPEARPSVANWIGAVCLLVFSVLLFAVSDRAARRLTDDFEE